MPKRPTAAILAIAALLFPAGSARAGWSIAHPSFTGGGFTAQAAGRYDLSASVGQGVAGAASGGRFDLVLGVLAPPGGRVAGIPSPPATPAHLAFLPPRPNPASAAVTFGVELPGESPVRLDVYGPDGRRVALVIDRVLPAGRHDLHWGAIDDAGRPLPPGVYLASLSAASHRMLRRVVLLGRP